MADNYLEKRYDEVFGQGARKTKRVGPTLDELLLKNRSCRGYLKDFVVTREMLERIVGVNTKIPSGRNQQALRFKLVTRDSGADKVLPQIKMGAALPELHLPFPGTEPEAFIIVCCEGEENKVVDIDLGISLQSMLLKAVEMGLNGLIVAAFNKIAVTEAFGLTLQPLAILCVGKCAEQIELTSISAGDNHQYYRQVNTSGKAIHYVPKVQLKDLIIP